MLSAEVFQTVLNNINPYFITLGGLDLTELSSEQWSAFLTKISENHGLIRVTLDDCNFANLSQSKLLALLDVLANCKNIHRLSVRSNHLSRITPASMQRFALFLQNLPNLVDLVLYDNNLLDISAEKLDVLGDALVKCQGLKKIDLGKNSLSGLGLKRTQAICSILNKCKQLECLDIEENGLLATVYFWRYLDPLLAKCKKIYLTNNNLSRIDGSNSLELAAALAGSKSLECISLGTENFADVWQEQWQYLGATLSKCASLATIEWKLGNFFPNEAQWEGFCDAATPKSLQKFELSCNSLFRVSADSWEYFGWALNRCPHLREIDISLSDETFIAQTPAQWRAFCNAITKNSNVQQINLSSHNLLEISAEKWRVFGDALANCKNLSRIELEGGDLDDTTIEQWQAFCNAITSNQSLQEIAFEIGQLFSISAARWQILDSALSRPNNLQVIELYAGYPENVSETQILEFGTSIAQLKCPQKFSLDLSVSNFSATKVLLLGDALAQWENLESISVRDINLDPALWKDWCNIFTRCSKLNHLNLSNMLSKAHTTSELEVLAETLKQCTVLESIDLRYNNLPEKSFAKIMSMLPEHVTTIMIEKWLIQPFLQNNNDKYRYVTQYDANTETAQLARREDLELRLAVMGFLYKLVQGRLNNQQADPSNGFLKQRGFYDHLAPYLTCHDIKKMQLPVVLPAVEPTTSNTPYVTIEPPSNRPAKAKQRGCCVIH